MIGGVAGAGRACLLVGCGLLFGCTNAGELAPFGSGHIAGGGGTGAAIATSEGGQGSEVSGTAQTEGTGPEPVSPDDATIVYSRCARTQGTVELSGDVVVAGETVSASVTLGYLDVYDRLPTSARYHSGFTAPCDLVLAHPDGAQEVLYACQGERPAGEVCAALDPAVSHDGKRIAFSVFRGEATHDEQRPAPQVLHPDAQSGDLAVFELPNVGLDAVEARLHILDLATGVVTALPHVPETFDSAPTFLADGRLVFTSTAMSQSAALVPHFTDEWYTQATSPPPQLFVMDPVGRDVQRLSSHGLSGEFYPLQLADGRIAHVGRHLFGALPYRHTNGSPGSPGGAQWSYHLFAIGPDATLLTPLFGSHTHLAGAPNHLTADRLTQGADGRLWFAEGSGSVGAGNIYSFAFGMDFVTGPGPAADPQVGDVFRPESFGVGFEWVSDPSRTARSVPPPALMLDGYADPLVYRGFLRDPEAFAQGQLLVSWAKGACSALASIDEALFPDSSPPGGNGALTAANMLQVLGKDSPGCDAGIYRTTVLPSSHPGDLEVVIDDPAYHEIMPRLVAPYGAVHAQAKPDHDPNPADDEPSAAIGDAASPFGTLLISSLLDRETRSVSGHPFASETAWALQGTDTGDYSDEEICGLRVLAVSPNVDGDISVGLRMVAAHRTAILGEVPARKRTTDGSGAPDTSIAIEVPANVPFVLQAIDCQGRTLNTSQTPMSVRPGEVERCHGCHRRSEPAIPLDATAAGSGTLNPTRLGAGKVSLLAGGDPLEPDRRSIPGWGMALEFERDVRPIFAARCMPCHDGQTAAAGLVLDAPGVVAGTTWWQLAADHRQTFVPAEGRAPAAADASLRKPQLTRYLRLLDARGSLLYWKAANARTDGRTDADFADDAPDGFADVDFGEDHPTAITEEELGLLARWIDTGAGAGELYYADTLAPTLAAAVDLRATGALLRVGTVDVGKGIDPASLTICLVSAGSCQLVASAEAAEAGVIEVPLPASDVEREVRIAVRDRAGNVTQIQRTIGTLAGADLASDPGIGDDGGTSNPTGGVDGTGTDSGGGEQGGESGCRVGGRGRPWILWLCLLSAAVGRCSRYGVAGRADRAA